MKLPSIAPVPNIKPPKPAAANYKTPLIKGSSLVSVRSVHLPPKPEAMTSPKALRIAQVAPAGRPRATRFATLKSPKI
jgi:hypothetical protein